jgi:hypothetical protein
MNWDLIAWNFIEDWAETPYVELGFGDFGGICRRRWWRRSESAYKPLVKFDVLNDNLIEGLIFLLSVWAYSKWKSINVFIDTSLEVQL